MHQGPAESLAGMRPCHSKQSDLGFLAACAACYVTYRLAMHLGYKYGLGESRQHCRSRFHTESHTWTVRTAGQSKTSSHGGECEQSGVIAPGRLTSQPDP